MKKIVTLAAAVTMLLGAMSAQAAGEATMGGLGFHSTVAPIGIREWFSDQLGFDLGVGFSSDGFKNKTPNSPTFKNASTFFVDLGLPWSAKKWDKVNFIVRPGFQYGSLKDDDAVIGNTKKANQWSVSGDFEVEVMLADKFSVSAAHGVAFTQLTDKSTANDRVFTNFSSSGENFTSLGFHVYLW